MTTLNVVMGFMYVLTHLCAVPVTVVIIAMSPDRFGIGARRNDDDLNWVEEDIELEHDSVLADTIRQRRRE